MSESASTAPEWLVRVLSDSQSNDWDRFAPGRDVLNAQIESADYISAFNTHVIMQFFRICFYCEKLGYSIEIQRMEGS